MVYLGRVDHQIKVQGHRVELDEVEALLQKEAGVEVAVAVGWPLTASGSRAIEAFLVCHECSYFRPGESSRSLSVTSFDRGHRSPLRGDKR